MSTLVLLACLVAGGVPVIAGAEPPASPEAAAPNRYASSTRGVDDVPPAQPDVQAQVLTLEEAARLLRVTPADLVALARRGEVPGRRIGMQWRFSRDVVLGWLAGDWERRAVERLPVSRDGVPGHPLQPGLSGHRPASLPEPALSAVRAGGLSVAQAQGSSSDAGEAGTGGATPGAPIGEAPERPSAEEVFLRGQRVLLARGQSSVDLGVFYSRADDRSLQLVDNGIGLATLEQDTLTTRVIGRYGLLDETELLFSTSYLSEDTGLFFGSRQLSESSRDEFGDVRLGLRRTVLREGRGVPDVIVGIEGHIPTGDTSFAIGGGVSLIKSFDPAVLFASGNYRHTFSREFGDPSRLEPEDQFDVTFGYALALNDRVTLSTSVTGLFTSASDFDVARLRAREHYSLQFGLTSWLAKGLYIEPTVSFGLDGPGSSTVFGVTLPYSF